MYSELWNKWAQCHGDAEQQKRIVSAKKAACSPITVDFTTGTANFSGSSGNHTTTLEKCSCIDYNRRRLPCKHMYRLAMEFELLNENYDTNMKAIVSKRKSIADTVKVIESMSDEQQRLLTNISEKLNNYNPIAYIGNTDNLQSIINSGILVKEADLVGVLGLYKKTELISLAESLNLEIPKGIKKKELADLLIESAADELASTDLAYIPVKYSPNIKNGKLRMYLHRKFDYEYAFSEGKREYGDIPLLETKLPDDDVTFLLRQYGHYKL
jgi:hypothetical protein